MSLSSPLVSIIMNCYNGDRFLKEAIDSIYAQTYNNWEIIFWDNASTDNSAEIACSYDDRVKYYLASETTPLGKARSLALSKATGKYIAFLDCDDLYNQDKLIRQVELLECSEAVLCYSSVSIMDERGRNIRKTIVRDAEGFIFEKLLYRYDINFQTAIFERSILSDNYIYMNDSLSYSPDYDLFMKIASMYKVISTSEILANYRLVKGGLTSRKYKHIAPEGKYTLDFIFDKMPSIREEYPLAVKSAYDKLHYYDSLYWINKGDYSTAKEKLKIVIFSRWQYFVIYLLLIFSCPKFILLKILRRT